MKLVALLLIAYLATAYCQSQYALGRPGQSCNEVCYGLEMNCNPVIETNNNIGIFAQLGIACQTDSTPWSAEDHPSYVSDTNHANYGKCLGYTNLPTATQCTGSNPSTQRVCRCDPPAYSPSTFGSVYSNGDITTQEKWIFEYFLAPGDVGVMSYFWTTYARYVDNGTIIRYYIDGETTASIEFTPSLFCGVGFYDNIGPWGTEWFGKGAMDGGWYNNFRIPFHKSIKITAQHLYANYTKFFMTVRGSTNFPITVGGRTLPSDARMRQFISKGTYQPMDFLALVNVSSGPGVHWMSTIQAKSGNIKFLEGCLHAYFDGNNQFPGVVLSTGGEDYFDSAWNFNAGTFHLPVSGNTHWVVNSTVVFWSGYRFHDQDPLFFKNGFQLVMRNGDAYDAAGTKCFTIDGVWAGPPTASDIIAYGWAYTWSGGSIMQEKYFYFIPFLLLIFSWL